MSLRKTEIVVVPWKELSDAIHEEIRPENYPENKGFLFWAFAPNTILELEGAPFWAEYCRMEDLKPGQKILIDNVDHL